MQTNWRKSKREKHLQYVYITERYPHLPLPSSNGGMITDASFAAIAEHALLKAKIAKHTGDET
jgi:hypothetical protein